jgi:2-oxoacid:acceptor oxidoreductase delta subunit (pyruvate/2-ketoisovalerate family)
LQGNNSAEAVHRALIGDGPSISIFGYLYPDERSRNPHIVTFEELNMDYFEVSPRQKEFKLVRRERVKGFEEVTSTLRDRDALLEAERCFSCGTCNECETCYVFCPDASIVRGEEKLSHEVNYDYCKGCGICFTECPRGAISLKEEAR